MASELDNAIAQVRSTLANIGGLRSAPPRPTEQAPAFPFMIVSADTGTWEESEQQGQIVGLHNITVEIHGARNDLPRDIEKIEPYGELVKDKLFKLGNQLFNNTIDTVNGPVNYTFGPIGYGGVPTIGWIITIPVQITSRETATAFTRGFN